MTTQASSVLTVSMLDLLRQRLLVAGPRPPGDREYVTGIDDAIAAVRRLIEAEAPGDPTEATWPCDDPEPTRLAHEYLQLELTSLLSMINATLLSLSPSRPGDNETRISLSEAREHVNMACASLGRDRGQESG